jgi:uncharacterized protein YkvS
MANRSITEQILSSIGNNTTAAVTPVVTQIDDAVAHTGPFYAITCLVEATIDVSECTTGIKENGGSGAMQAIATNVVIPKGVTIYGNFESIELDGGTVLAYSHPGITVTVASS